MKKHLTELLADYRHSIEDALAGLIYNKKDDELSDDEKENAKKAVVKITNLVDYINLGDEVDAENREGALHILRRYGANISESNLVDRDLLQMEGYTYAGKFPVDMAGRIERYLEENEIDFMHDGEGQFQIKLSDRSQAYKANEGISRIISRNNPRLVRDSVNIDEVKKEQSKERDPNAATLAANRKAFGKAGPLKDKTKYSRKGKSKDFQDEQ